MDLPPGHSLAWSGQHEYVTRGEAPLLLVAPATLPIITLMLFLAFNRATGVGIVLALSVALSAGDEATMMHEKGPDGLCGIRAPMPAD